ncbi:ATP-dependent RNA helicase SrmB [Alteromonas sp. a30]|uniref:ATP-dependent RNA helicase SrmB n=1 Tax=Alteromonas sp. a30 TaxID=2730917 RepID=UPI00227DF91F|nr:ATP-dependent RNA helicase SrmB [Alteromonas sp. a30]MCY7296012.1 ATP-dependent RNA helicase SrmB [Alteromonas sp. a30]
MFEQFLLDENICKALAEMGFKEPTSIQKAAVPVALEGRDLLASAPTGTGKTAAFLLPVCQMLLDFPRREPGSARVLILTPTRELAIQVAEQCKQICQYTNLTCGVITGGINYGTDNSLLEQSVDILVATPGRLFEHINNERFDCREIESLILDEADRMLDMGFGGIVNQISAEARWRRQSMLFSATLEGNGVKTFAENILNEPEVVIAEPSRKERPKILQWIHYADTYDHKVQLLTHILQNDTTSVIVFVKTRERVQQLQSQLQGQKIHSLYLQGEMAQDKRMSTLEKFKKGECQILLATDVAARGIDIPNVSHVINFDMPRTADVYVHRIGRTGRSGQKGIAISLIEAHDMAMLSKIERYTEQKLKPQFIEGLRPKHKVASTKKKPKKKKDDKKKKSAPKVNKKSK